MCDFPGKRTSLQHGPPGLVQPACVGFAMGFARWIRCFVQQACAFGVTCKRAAFGVAQTNGTLAMRPVMGHDHAACGSSGSNMASRAKSAKLGRRQFFISDTHVFDLQRVPHIVRSRTGRCSFIWFSEGAATRPRS